MTVGIVGNNFWWYSVAGLMMTVIKNSLRVIILDIDAKGNHKGAKLLAGDRNSNVDNSHSLG